MKFQKIFFLLALLIPNLSYCTETLTRIAWIEMRDANGQIIQLEPEMLYAHVAIQIGEQWLHAHPKHGVVLSDSAELQKTGVIREVWASDKENDSYLDHVSFFVGREFDSEFSWTDEKIYCAELIAKLLSIAPSPMHFDEKLWDPWFKKYEGLPGSSPSKLYSEVQRRGYERVF